MNRATRIAVVVVALLLCVGGGIIANFSNAQISGFNNSADQLRQIKFTDAYQRAATNAQEKPNPEIESIILRDPATNVPGAVRIEIGFRKIEPRQALVEVMFFSRNERMRPYLYKLVPLKNSWRVESVQRMWFVPRSHLRGLRV